jgi:lysozyme family protein
VSKTLNLGLQWLERAEGGHVKLPGDPGGDTYYGISRAFHPNETPWPPSQARAQEILATEYWKPEWDQLPQSVAIVLFDAAVNQGAEWAVQTLQRRMMVEPDGVVGPATLAAVRSAIEPANQLLAARAIFYAGEGYAMGLIERLLRLRSFLTANSVV